MVKHVYVFFIGVLLATFIGVGVAAFYPGPQAPEYPISTTVSQKPECSASPEQIQFETEQRRYLQLNRIYSRNVSIITVSFSVIILVISLTLLAKLPIISDGLLLGGLFTQLYSVVRGFASEDDKFRFIVVTIALITSLTVGYLKFIKPEPKKKLV